MIGLRSQVNTEVLGRPVGTTFETHEEHRENTWRAQGKHMEPTGKTDAAHRENTGNIQGKYTFFLASQVERRRGGSRVRCSGGCLRSRCGALLRACRCQRSIALVLLLHERLQTGRLLKQLLDGVLMDIKMLASCVNNKILHRKLFK